MQGCMAYLYAGLGVAMLTGIMAVFEMATSYVQFQNTWQPASEAQSSLYYNGLAGKDRNIMQVIETNPGLDVCNADEVDDIKESFSLDKFAYIFSGSVANFSGGCSYASSEHRIIFDSNRGLWSCALPSIHPLDKDSKCEFEL